MPRKKKDQTEVIVHPQPDLPTHIVLDRVEYEALVRLYQNHVDAVALQLQRLKASSQLLSASSSQQPVRPAPVASPPRSPAKKTAGRPKGGTKLKPAAP